MIKTLEEDSQDNKPQMMILVTMLLLVSKQLSVCTQTMNELIILPLIYSVKSNDPKGAALDKILKCSIENNF